MRLAQVEQEERRPEFPEIDRELSTEDGYCLRRGEFIATVRPHEDRYSFSVRDTRRERPTIHGFGVDFPNALVAVTELLDALTREV